VARLTEFQSKELLRSSGILTPKGAVGATPEACGEIAAQLGGTVVVKAQIGATNRAEIGAVRVVSSAREAATAAREMFEATEAAQILVEERIKVAAEYYVGIVMDDRERCPVLLASASGGSGIEQRESTIHRISLDVLADVSPKQFLAFTIAAGLPEDASLVLERLWRLARRSDARSAEINPLARSENGQLIALDCRTIPFFAIQSSALISRAKRRRLPPNSTTSHGNWNPTITAALFFSYSSRASMKAGP